LRAAQAEPAGKVASGAAFLPCFGPSEHNTGTDCDGRKRETLIQRRVAMNKNGGQNENGDNKAE